MEKYIVNIPAAPLLAKPETGAGLADEILYGWEIEVTERLDNGFCKVKTEYGYEGYVRDCYCDIQRYCERPHCEAIHITAPFADIMPTPDIKNRATLTLFRGSFVFNAREEHDGWSKVTLADGGEGFIRTRYCGISPQYQNDNSPDFRQKVVKTALSYMGAPYRWGGKTPMGIDCSGLAFMAYFLNGVTIYRDSCIEESTQKGYPVKKISYIQAKCGDLLYFPGHIGIYMGEGRFIHSSHSNNGVAVNSFNENAHDYRADLKETLICAGACI